MKSPNFVLAAHLKFPYEGEANLENSLIYPRTLLLVESIVRLFPF